MHLTKALLYLLSKSLSYTSDALLNASDKQAINRWTELLTHRCAISPIASDASLAIEHRLCAMVQVLWQSGALASKGQCPLVRQTLSVTTSMLEPLATACLCACWCLGHFACCPIQVSIRRNCCSACIIVCNLLMLRMKAAHVCLLQKQYSRCPSCPCKHFALSARVAECRCIRVSCHCCSMLL